MIILQRQFRNPATTAGMDIDRIHQRRCTRLVLASLAIQQLKRNSICCFIYTFDENRREVVSDWDILLPGPTRSLRRLGLLSATSQPITPLLYSKNNLLSWTARCIIRFIPALHGYSPWVVTRQHTPSHRHYQSLDFLSLGDLLPRMIAVGYMLPQCGISHQGPEIRNV